MNEHRQRARWVDGRPRKGSRLHPPLSAHDHTHGSHTVPCRVKGQGSDRDLAPGARSAGPRAGSSTLYAILHAGLPNEVLNPMLARSMIEACP